jgi:hypothetical protein
VLVSIPIGLLLLVAWLVAELAAENWVRNVAVLVFVVMPIGILFFVVWSLVARPAAEEWVWYVLVAVLVSIPIGLLLLGPWSIAYSDGLLDDMPCVEMVRTIDAEVVQNGSANTATGEEVKGVLLSNDSAYWYVLDDSKGRVLAIPLAEASEIQVLPRLHSDMVCP